MAEELESIVHISEKYDRDALLDCLVIFTKLHGRPMSAEALTIGLPVENGKSTPTLFSLGRPKALFSRAAAKAGFKTKIMRVPIEDISNLLLPCILLLKGKGEVKACILQGFDAKKEKAKIILPELGEMENLVPLEELQREYFGMAFFLKKELRYDDRELQALAFEDKHWFWGAIKSVKDIYRDVIIASLLTNLFVLATPLFTMNVYDRVVPTAATDTLWALATGIIIVYLIDMGMKFVRTYYLEIAGKKCDIIMSSVIFEKVLDLNLSSFPKSIGSFANILKEFESVRGFLTSSTIALVIDLPFVFIFLIAIYLIAGLLVWIPIVFFLILLAYTIVTKNKLDKLVKTTYKAAAMKNSILIEALSTIEELKTLGALGNAQWKWEESTGDIAEKSVNTKFLSATITTISAFLLQLNTVIVIIFGVYMIKDLQLTMGALIATVIISQRAIAPMGQVAGLLASYEHVKAAYQAIDAIMKLPTEHPDGKKFVKRPEFQGIIEFRNVFFSYPDNDKSALTNLSFRVYEGEHVAIVGKIGSGKTTIQKLIMGLYYPDEGSILIDGIDIKQIDPADLRKNIGFVSQDTVLFSGTVRENIIYKAPHADDEAMIRAASVSGVLDFVNQHPKGFDMPVGERGAQLSGGQRQSVGIARAILLDSPVILMDEPTSSMDSGTENLFINRFKKYYEGKTVIIVTHKSSMLQLADRIIVTDNGHIVLDGDKDYVLESLKGKG